MDLEEGPEDDGGGVLTDIGGARVRCQERDSADAAGGREEPEEDEEDEKEAFAGGRHASLDEGEGGKREDEVGDGTDARVDVLAFYDGGAGGADGGAVGSFVPDVLEGDALYDEEDEVDDAEEDLGGDDGGEDDPPGAGLFKVEEREGETDPDECYGWDPY